MLQTNLQPPAVDKSLATEVPYKQPHKLQAWAKRNPVWAIAALVFAVLAVYWLLVASDRYVSVAHIVVQRTDLPAGGAPDGILSLISGASSASRTDQLMMRDYLLSVGLLQKLNAELQLSQHFSNTSLDWPSRLGGAKLPIEDLHSYYLKRVSVELDDHSGVLVLSVQAYAPEVAQRLNQRLVQEGERFMNGLANELARSQVEFLEGQVANMQQRSVSARQAVLAYQNKNGLVSPQAAAESGMAVIAKLQGTLAELQVERSALQAYLVSTHPSVVRLGQHIAAVQRQLNKEQAKLASPQGSALNKTVEAYQRLETQAKFAEAVYQTALVALEKGRIEALRTIKKLSVLEAPTLPEYPLQPRRAYNTLVSLLAIALLAGLVQLLLAVVQDHKD
jgi:capsular polysaccharide transport system permease protein